MNLKEIAAELGISVNTLRKWMLIKRIKIVDKMGYCYTPKQEKRIFEKIGKPRKQKGKRKKM